MQHVADLPLHHTKENLHFSFFNSFLTEGLVWSSQKSIADFPMTSEESVLDPYSSSYPDIIFIKKNTFLISQQLCGRPQNIQKPMLTASLSSYIQAGIWWHSSSEIAKIHWLFDFWWLWVPFERFTRPDLKRELNRFPQFMYISLGMHKPQEM